jgi:hypothetical protein
MPALHYTQRLSHGLLTLHQDFPDFEVLKTLDSEGGERVLFHETLLGFGQLYYVGTLVERFSVALLFHGRPAHQACPGRSPITGIFVDGTSSPSHR